MDSPRRIMLVDGSDATRKMVGQLLRKQAQDLDVICFHSAREALAHLKLEHFDLISTALSLPDMDGLDFTHKLRELNGHAKTPVIVVSGDASHHAEAGHEEVTDFFDKSKGIQALVGFIVAHLPAGDTGKAAPPAAPAQPARVLYVEDSLTAAMAVKRMLDKHGIEVVHVMTAEEALERLKAGEQYALVMSDLFLPGRMSGGDLVRQIRHALKFTADALPILMVTVGGNTEAEVAKLLQTGANDYVTKPLAESLLLEKLGALMRCGG